MATAESSDEQNRHTHFLYRPMVYQRKYTFMKPVIADMISTMK